MQPDINALLNAQLLQQYLHGFRIIEEVDPPCRAKHSGSRRIQSLADLCQEPALACYIEDETKKARCPDPTQASLGFYQKNPQPQTTRIDRGSHTRRSGSADDEVIAVDNLESSGRFNNLHSLHSPLLIATRKWFASYPWQKPENYPERLQVSLVR